MSATPLPAFPSPDDPPEYRASHASLLRGVPRENRIFVNRNLRMRSIEAVGFDLDYTLAHYRLWEIDDLAFRITQQKLVEKRGHDEGILEIPFDPEFVVRGLVIDRRRGNILKMDYHNYVVRGFHGRTPLDAAERKRIYHSRRIRISGEAYVSVDTLFHMPEVYLYLALVDFYEEGGKKPDYRRLYQDVRDMIDEAHADGSLKAEIRRDPSRFISPDPRLGESLDSLRESGKKVFLLTNSELYYTDVLLSHLLEEPGSPPWRSRFDFIAVEAGKPTFFLKRNEPMRPVETDGAGPPVYSGGGVSSFEDLLGFHGDRILYWGDHTYGDILRSKKNVGWRTAMIIPELESEIAISGRLAPKHRELDEAIEKRHRLEQEQHRTLTKMRRLQTLVDGSLQASDDVTREIRKKLERMQSRVERVREEREAERTRIARLDRECNEAHNPHWGLLFREANEITRFGHQVKDFACIYTSRVSNLLHYPPNTYFRAAMDRLPHEL